MALPTGIILIAVAKTSTSYHVRLSKSPGSGNTVTILERTDSEYFQSVGSLNQTTWETGLDLSSRVSGTTYYIIGESNDGTILGEVNVTLQDQDPTPVAEDLTTPPRFVETGSIDTIARYQKGFRSPEWKTKYENE